MRPHRLELTAIGSYPDDVVIDFDALAPYGLFHIHGPTGAGKSSLLDAMCFALYGRLPPPRLPESLRSHHAAPSVEAVVTFEFAAQNADWRIVRKPKQLRAKKVGQGTTEQLESVTLLRRDAGGWMPVTSASKEVAKIVDGLVGLDAVQFMQVVVLPQGGFQRALRATDAERASLLSKLFDTERFVRYSERLKQRADTLRRDYQMRAARPLGMIQQAKARVAALNLHVAWPIEAAVDQAHVDCLQEAARRSSDLLETALRHRSTAEDARAHIDQDLAGLLELSKHQTTRDNARETLARLESESEDIALNKERLRLASDALPLTPVLRAFSESSQRHSTAQSKRDVAISRVADSLLAMQQSGYLDNRLPQTFSGQSEGDEVDAIRSELRRQARAIDVLMVRRDEGQSIESAWQASEALIQRTAEECERQTQFVTDAAQRITSLTEKRAAIGERIKNAPVTPESIARLEGFVEAGSALATSSDQLREQELALLAADKRSVDASRRHLALLKAKLEGMAGELAAGLSDDCPCPVCGATEHPQPAALSAQYVDDEQVQAADQSAAKAESDANALRDQFDRSALVVEALTVKAGPAAGALADVTAELHDARRKLGEHLDAIATLEQVDNELATLSQDQDAAVSLLEQLRSKAAQLVTLAEADAQELSNIAQELAAAVEPNASLANVRSLIDGLHAELDAFSVAAGVWYESHSALQAASQRFDEAMAESPFDSAEHLRSATLSSREMEALAQSVETFTHACASANAVLAEPEPAVVVSPDDIVAARTRQQQAIALHHRAIERSATVEAEANALSDLARSFANEARMIEPMHQQEQRIRALYELCHGNNHRRMDLQRYVLAAYLEEVAVAASTRLRSMSSGRYSLRHSDERARNNAASGLTLLVADVYTGKEREVSTLSGGETFLASLALALGLADVVQAHAGGVEIEALFIDEGFGSLDPDSFEIAMVELDRLREGGRMVGVISHVPTLRERIPAGIEVVASSRGSTVRMHTGAEPTVVKAS